MDKEIILNFLKHFKLIIAVEGEILVHLECLDEIIKFKDFKNLFIKIFNTEYDKVIFDTWYDCEIYERIKDFKNFLDKCYVVLGRTQWETRHPKYGLINLNVKNLILSDFSKIDSTFLERQYEEWLENKIIETSMKIMNHY